MYWYFPRDLYNSIVTWLFQQNLVCDNLDYLPFYLDEAVGGFLNGNLPLICGGLIWNYIPSCACLTLNKSVSKTWTWTFQSNILTECRFSAAAAVLPGSSHLNDSHWIAGGKNVYGMSKTAVSYIIILLATFVTKGMIKEPHFHF